MTGAAPPPMPAKASSWAIYEAFPTADEKTIFIGITSDNHWRSFCSAFGLEDLLADASLRTNPQRALARNRIAPVVADIVKRTPYDAMAAKLEALNIPFAPLNTPCDLFDDPHLTQGGRMVDVQFPNGKRAPLPAIPLEMDSHRFTVRHQPPRHGQHTRGVLEEAGYSVAEIDALIAQGVILANPEP
jgi:crotonobetainyl-CoA:carnitine CoA-transferase CaiB-like acyl-CoA transferase